MISVIIPTYNRRQLLMQALSSVQSQTAQPQQVIVVDDGSTDGTPEWLATQPVTLVRLTHSGKPPIARNAGLGRVTGEYVAFLDSDDVWEASALADLLGALNACQSAGFAFCPDSSALPMPYMEGRALDVFDDLLGGCFLQTGCLLFRRALCRAVGAFDERCLVADDWDYWLRAAALSTGVFVNKPLLRLRPQPDSISRAPGGKIFADNVRTAGKALLFCLRHRPSSLALAARALWREATSAVRYRAQRALRP